MEFYCDDKGIELGLFKLDDKGRTFFEVARYKESDKKRIYEIADRITPDTPEKEIEKMFENIDCTLRTKRHFAKAKRFDSKPALYIYATVCILFAIVAYWMTLQ